MSWSARLFATLFFASPDVPEAVRKTLSRSIDLFVAFLLINLVGDAMFWNVIQSGAQGYAPMLAVNAVITAIVFVGVMWLIVAVRSCSVRLLKALKFTLWAVVGLFLLLAVYHANAVSILDLCKALPAGIALLLLRDAKFSSAFVATE